MPSYRKRAVVLTTAAACLLSPLAAAPAVAAADATAVKTLVVGIDGASFDFLDDADMPNLDALRGRGMVSSSNLYGTPLAGTISGPGWSTIATGVWPDKHDVVDNNFTAPRYDLYPDYLTRIEAAQPERSTAVVATWSPIATTVFGSAVDSRIQGGNDVGTTAKAVEAIAGGADDVFVHLDEVDGAGHSTGTNGAAYAQALAKADGEIGEILAAVDARPADEEWTIVVTADHGHTPTGGHGGSSPAERKVFVIAAGPGIEPGVRHDVKITDVAPPSSPPSASPRIRPGRSTARPYRTSRPMPSTRCAPSCRPARTRPVPERMSSAGRMRRRRGGASTTPSCPPAA